MEWEANHPLTEHGRQKHYILMAGLAALVAVSRSGGHWADAVFFMAVRVGIAAVVNGEREVDSRGLTVEGSRSACETTC